MAHQLNHFWNGQARNTTSKKRLTGSSSAGSLDVLQSITNCLRSLCEMPKNEQWRKVLAADLALFNAAIFFFALLPPNTVVVQEQVIMAMAVMSLIGVISHATSRVTLPFENWAYLLTGATGLLTLFAYEIFAQTDLSQYRITYGLFLVSGIISAYAAHLIDGGKREGSV
jgi:hypothetical protein